MHWLNRLRASGETKAADPRGETVINGMPHDAHKASQRPENPAGQGSGADLQIAEEIKQRQIALAVRYVTVVRAR